ncbi:hypothetical protein [Bradyrhizobium guangdongense]|uniref:Uncharacterized protein n=1 Tax=Bradyrhizobium guangdongense TaxID=1325090 RepID=A0AA88B5C3_9BRAD|nr:hypothetical protein [Bradyrhizobium guangdongense]GGI21272.1 hypothetical protein GCM10010987_13490 [Bradyrhizobium guangdongense]
MATTEYTHTASSAQATRDYDGWITAGYSILGAIALIALYFALGGPGNGEAALPMMVAMP